MQFQFSVSLRGFHCRVQTPSLHFQERSVIPFELQDLPSREAPASFWGSPIEASDLVLPELDMRLTFFISSYSLIITSPEKENTRKKPDARF